MAPSFFSASASPANVDLGARCLLQQSDCDNAMRPTTDLGIKVIPRPYPECVEIQKRKSRDWPHCKCIRLVVVCARRMDKTHFAVSELVASPMDATSDVRDLVQQAPIQLKNRLSGSIIDVVVGNGVVIPSIARPGRRSLIRV